MIGLQKDLRFASTLASLSVVVIRASLVVVVRAALVAIVVQASTKVIPSNSSS